MAGILHPFLMGGGQGLLAPPTPAAPMAQQSGGLLSMFMPEVGQNKFYQGFDRNRDALTNAFFGMVGQDGPRGAARGFAQGAAAGNQADQVRRAKMEEQQKARDQVNKTVGWLTNKFGLSPEDAQAAAGNPSILNHYLKLAQAGGQEESVYGTPIYGTDANGNTVLGVIGKDGSFKKLDTGGVTPTPGVQFRDFGTYQQGFGKGGQAVTPPIANDPRGVEREKSLGKAEGETIANMPGDIMAAEQSIAQIDQLMNHPGLASIVGPMDQYRPNWTMSDDGRDALARFNQIKGRAFLEAYSMLKGGGQITEVEGLKAEQAMARLDRATSEQEFRRALADFRDAVQAGIQKLRQKAGAAIPGQPPAPAGGYKIIGVE